MGSLQVSPQTLDTSPGVAPLTPANLRRIVVDMGAEPGWVSAGDLYSWYAGMCQEAEAAPVSKVMFGKALRLLGYESSTQRRNGGFERGWFLTKRAFRGEVR